MTVTGFGTDLVFMVFINNYDAGDYDITLSKLVVTFYRPNGAGSITVAMPTEVTRTERYFVVGCFVSATGLSVIYPVLQFTDSDPEADFSFCSAVIKK